MKRFFNIMILILPLLFLISTQLWAECKVNNISLQKDSSFTKLVIYADAPFEYKHFTVEAKDGKSYRIVVDILDAVHNLSQNNFLNIPGETVIAIRTSQFSIEPNKSVRVVLDVTKPIVYRIENEKENQIGLTISTPDDIAFPFWAANMAPFEKQELQLAQVVEKKEEKQKKQEQISGSKIKPAEDKVLPLPQEKIAVKEVGVKKKEMPKIKAVEESDAKKKTKIPSKPEFVAKEKLPQKGITEKSAIKEKEVKVAQTEKLPKVKSKKVAEKVKIENKAENKVGTDDTSVVEISKVDQLKKKAELKAKAIKSQVEKIRPRGEVIEAVYKRKVITYESDSRRDPFTPMGEGISVEFGQAPEPAYESLKLVGILKDISGNMALLEDGEGYGYIMRQGDRVKSGEVIYVGDDRIIFQVTEYGWSKTIAIELSNKK